MEIYSGALDICKIQNSWYEIANKKNCGALINFIGIVRDDGGVQGLSFDIYEPMLKIWFKNWQEKVVDLGVFLFFAHSKGDVFVGQSSYISGVLSKNRNLALNLISEFVQDFKANAPIWKYDIIDNKRIYAENRSQEIKGAGLLSENN